MLNLQWKRKDKIVKHPQVVEEAQRRGLPLSVVLKEYKLHVEAPFKKYESPNQLHMQEALKIIQEREYQEMTKGLSRSKIHSNSVIKKFDNTFTAIFNIAFSMIGVFVVYLYYTQNEEVAWSVLGGLAVALIVGISEVFLYSLSLKRNNKSLI